MVGFDCAHAAYEALAREHFDLMISDIEMPGMDGLELLGVLRSVKPQVPAILMSGHPDPGMAELAIKAGADAFVPKEPGPVRLCDEAERVLGPWAREGGAVATWIRFPLRHSERSSSAIGSSRDTVVGARESGG